VTGGVVVQGSRCSRLPNICLVGKTTALLETSVEEIFAEFSSYIYSTIDESVFSSFVLGAVL
jgi:hypothetical protein